MFGSVFVMRQNHLACVNVQIVANGVEFGIKIIFRVFSF